MKEHAYAFLAGMGVTVALIATASMLHHHILVGADNDKRSLFLFGFRSDIRDLKEYLGPLRELLDETELAANIEFLKEFRMGFEDPDKEENRNGNGRNLLDLPVRGRRSGELLERAMRTRAIGPAEISNIARDISFAGEVRDENGGRSGGDFAGEVRATRDYVDELEVAQPDPTRFGEDLEVVKDTVFPDGVDSPPVVKAFIGETCKIVTGTSTSTCTSGSATASVTCPSDFPFSLTVRPFYNKVSGFSVSIAQYAAFVDSSWCSRGYSADGRSNYCRFYVGSAVCTGWQFYAEVVCCKNE